jgi:hypothetical protein
MAECEKCGKKIWAPETKGLFDVISTKDIADKV